MPKCKGWVIAFKDLAPVDQKVDNAIHRINHYPVDSVVCFVNIYPLDSDLSGGYSVIQPLNNRGQVWNTCLMHVTLITDNDAVLWKVCYNSQSQDVLDFPATAKIVTSCYTIQNTE